MSLSLAALQTATAQLQTDVTTLAGLANPGITQAQIDAITATVTATDQAAQAAIAAAAPPAPAQ